MKKMIDPDFVQDHSQKAPEGKGRLKYMILDVFQWVNRLKTKIPKISIVNASFSQKQVPEAVRTQISSMIFFPFISNDS